MIHLYIVKQPENGGKGKVKGIEGLLHSQAIPWTNGERITTVSAVVVEFNWSAPTAQPAIWDELRCISEISLAQIHGSLRDTQDGLTRSKA